MGPPNRAILPVLLCALLLCADIGGAQSDNDLTGSQPPGSALQENVVRLATDSRGRLPLNTYISIDFEAVQRGRPASVLGSEVLPMYGADMQLIVSASLDRLEPSLARYVKFMVSGRAAFSAGAGVNVKVLELNGRLLSGLQIEYEARMPQADYRGAAPPNPFNPESIAVGTELMLEAVAYRGHKLEATFRGIAADTDYGDWRGTAIGVEKIGPGRVRVLTGPTEGVRENMFIGLKLGKHLKLGLGNISTLKQYRLKTAEFQIDSRAGRQAYNHLWLTGRIVDWGAGMDRLGIVSKTTFLSETSARVKAGPIEAGSVLASNEGSRKDTQYYGSRRRSQELAIRYGNNATVIKTEFDGDAPIERKIDIVYRDLSGTIAAYLQQAFTGRSGKTPRGRWDVHIVLDEAQALRIRRTAAEYLARQSTPGTSFYLPMLAQSKDAVAVASGFVRALSVPKLAEDLLLMSFDTRSPVPGAVELLSRPKYK